MMLTQVWAIALTLAAYVAATVVSQRGRKHALLNPTLLAIAIVATVLLGLGGDPAAYRRGADTIHLLLGPAVVALAVPLYRHAGVLRLRAGLLAGALLAASTLTILATLCLARWFGATTTTVLSLAPKSATAAVSMAISVEIGGIPALTAVVTILAGITGAVIGPPLLDALGIRDPIARGYGIGIASHGIGTARAFQEGEATGTASGLAMGLNTLLTALLVPFVLALAALVPSAAAGGQP